MLYLCCSLRLHLSVQQQHHSSVSRDRQTFNRNAPPARSNAGLNARSKRRRLKQKEKVTALIYCHISRPLSESRGIYSNQLHLTLSISTLWLIRHNVMLLQEQMWTKRMCVETHWQRSAAKRGPRQSFLYMLKKSSTLCKWAVMRCSNDQ